MNIYESIKLKMEAETLTGKELEDMAQWLYDNHVDEWYKFSDEELLELASLCQISKNNPFGKAYDDEVFDELEKRGLTPKGYDSKEIIDNLIKDEEEAIEAYEKAEQQILQTNISSEDYDECFKTFEHIIAEEKEHIEELKKLLGGK